MAGIPYLIVLAVHIQSYYRWWAGADLEYFGVGRTQEPRPLRINP